MRMHLPRRTIRDAIATQWLLWLPDVRRRSTDLRRLEYHARALSTPRQHRILTRLRALTLDLIEFLARRPISGSATISSKVEIHRNRAVLLSSFTQMGVFSWDVWYCNFASATRKIKSSSALENYGPQLSNTLSLVIIRTVLAMIQHATSPTQNEIFRSE